MNKVVKSIVDTRVTSGDCRDVNLHCSNSGLDLRELQDPVRVGRSVGHKVGPGEGNNSVFSSRSVCGIGWENDGLIGHLLQH
jgi:hypothetical protein